MYRAVNGLVPSYISDIMPPAVANVSRYELRDSNNIYRPPVRTATFSKSCIPSAIHKWNNLQAPLRECDSYNAFCTMLKLQAYNKIPSYFRDGKRKLSVFHPPLRNFCSNLNQDLFDNYLREDPLCSCLKGNETAEHYIFSCEHYIEQRVRLFRNTREFHPLNVNMLLNGKFSISDSDNAKLFRHVQNYIHATGRFTR